MKNNSDKETNKEYTFDAICFSTNFTDFNAIKIINQYLMSADCNEINRNDDEYKVNFKHKLKIGTNTELECMNSYLEIAPNKKSVKISLNHDCFVIFVDMEYNDSLGELSKVLKMITNLSENDKNLFIINFFTQETDIKKDINDKNIKNMLERFGFNNYDIFKINMNIPDEITKTIDKITLETLQDKKLLDFENKDANNDKSESICKIY